MLSLHQRYGSVIAPRWRQRLLFQFLQTNKTRKTQQEFEEYIIRIKDTHEDLLHVIASNFSFGSCYREIFERHFPNIKITDAKLLHISTVRKNMLRDGVKFIHGLDRKALLYPRTRDRTRVYNDNSYEVDVSLMVNKSVFSDAISENIFFISTQ